MSYLDTSVYMSDKSYNRICDSVAKCPYCKNHLLINIKANGISEEQDYEYTCGYCGKIFIYTTTIKIAVKCNTKKADCLNNGKHKWGKFYKDSLGRQVRECIACCAISHKKER